jgi:A/G-specific adenine glycosylase
MAINSDPFARPLLDWYARSGRHDLPWQISSTPYRVWISEVMLQQTQVATVIPFFERFVEKFPVVRSLAAADINDVLALWSGLGYYARARNLHRAAQAVVALYDGELPRNRDALEALPGIGRSTAAAILALSFGTRHAILDGNVKRVLARYHAVAGWAGQAAVLKTLWTLAEEHTPNGQVADYTQAIMDLGATVCTRARPACRRCPVARGCAALASDRVGELPAPRPKKPRPRRRSRILVLRNDAGEFLLERRPPSGIWGGLLSFPELADDETAAAWCRMRIGCEPGSILELTPVEHGFTHFELTMEPAYIELEHSPAAVMDRNRWLWYNADAAAPGGIPAPISRLIERLNVARADS